MASKSSLHCTVWTKKSGKSGYRRTCTKGTKKILCAVVKDPFTGIWQGACGSKTASGKTKIVQDAHAGKTAAEAKKTIDREIISRVRKGTIKL